MTEIKLGDRVRIKGQKDWPSPPGYRLAYAEGTVGKWVEWDETMDDFQDFVFVRLEKAEGEGKPYIGNEMFFKAEYLEKI